MYRKIAVVDVGSNSVRLMLLADGKILYKRTVITRLGEGLALTGCLQQKAIERTVAQVSVFFDQAKEEGATEFYAYATAAVRAASNGKDFVFAMKEQRGITAEVVSGEEEALIGIMGALGEKDGALLDVGGGSSELVVRTDGKIVYQHSADVGVVRLKDLCGRDKATLSAICGEKVKEFSEAKGKITTLYAVGGTATTLAALSLGLTAYDGAKVTGTTLSLAEVKDLTDKLFSLTVEEIAALPCIDEKRAQVITGGAFWIEEIMRYLSLDRLIVSDCDNLEGYAKLRGLI